MHETCRGETEQYKPNYPHIDHIRASWHLQNMVNVRIMSTSGEFLPCSFCALGRHKMLPALILYETILLSHAIDTDRISGGVACLSER